MACDSETASAAGDGDVAGKALPPRRWLTALGIYLAASFLWAGTAPAALALGFCGIFGLSPVTPMAGILIGDMLTWPEGDSDEDDCDDSPFSFRNLAFASIYSLVVLSPGLMWLRTRKSDWKYLQGVLLYLSFIGTTVLVCWGLSHFFV